MNELTLPSVRIVAENQELAIRHIKTGMVVRVSQKTLDRWALRMLRDELSPAPSREQESNSSEPA